MPRSKRVPQPETGTDTVTVCLKHPTGIVIQAQEKFDDFEMIPGGSRPVKVWRKVGKEYVIHGNAVPANARPNCVIVGEYAMTQGVPRAVWENWLELNGQSALVENHLISAHDSQDRAEGFADEHEETRSGMEPMALSGDPRTPKRRNRFGKFEEAIVQGTTDD